MGLTGAPASFSKLMEQVMRDLTFVLVYLDDLLCASSSHDAHLDHLRTCFLRLRQFNLKLNIDKSSFAAASVQYLGHTVDASGFTIGEHKFLAVRNFPEPTTPRQVRQFLGLANFFRQLIPEFTKWSGQLSPLTSVSHDWKGGPLPPGPKAAFIALREKLLQRPVVAFPDPNEPFTLALSLIHI